MKCVICRHGQTRTGKVTVTLERNASAIIFRSVPAQVCGNCGEQYLDAQTSARLLEQAQRAAAAGVDIEVVTFAAA